MERKAPPRGAREGVKADLKASREGGQAGFAAGVAHAILSEILPSRPFFSSHMSRFGSQLHISPVGHHAGQGTTAWTHDFLSALLPDFACYLTQCIAASILSSGCSPVAERLQSWPHSHVISFQCSLPGPGDWFVSALVRCTIPSYKAES